MFFLNGLVLNIVERGRRFHISTISIPFINKVHLSKNMVAEALILRTKCIYKEECPLNLRNNTVRVKKELFSMNLPDLSAQCLGVLYFSLIRDMYHRWRFMYVPVPSSLK